MQHSMFKLFFILLVVEDRYNSANAYYGYTDYCEQIGNGAEDYCKNAAGAVISSDEFRWENNFINKYHSKLKLK